MKKEIEEAWLHAQVGPAFDALKADPGRAVTADKVRTRLAKIAQAVEPTRRVDAGQESLTSASTRPKT